MTIILAILLFSLLQQPGPGVDQDLILLVNRSISETSISFNRLCYLQQVIKNKISKEAPLNIVNKSAEQL